jgi:hypothetical protein
MLGLNIVSNLKTYLPYGIIGYLLFAGVPGTGSPELPEVDLSAAKQISVKTEQYLAYIPAAPSLPNNAAGNFVRTVINTPSKLLNGGTNYGY